MAGSLNLVQVIGNLGADPEMRYTPQGRAMTRMSIAANEAWTSPDGEKRERVEWFSVIAWGKLAEIASQYLAKGRRVYVSGRQQTRSWTSDDGVKHWRTELIAGRLLMLDGPRGGASETAAEPTSDPDSGEVTDYGENDIPF